MSNPDDGMSPFRRNVLSGLTKLAHGSAAFITTFVLIHLSAPALANLGGSSLSSQTMLLGREYYQTAFGENYLLFGPIAIHSFAGITKRLLSPNKSPASPRPLSSLLTITGYATFLFFLPIHYTTHRLLPASPDAPISSLGPAELDFEFVKLGLQRWPWTNWFLYVGLVGSVALHMADGLNIINNTWFRTWTRGKAGVFAGRKRMRALALGGLVLPVLTGLYVISREPPMVFSSIARRFEAVFLESGMYFA